MVNPTAMDIGKIRQDMNTMEVRFNKMSTANSRNRTSNKPRKPEVTPPRRRGGFNRVEVVGNFTILSIMTDLRIMIVMVVKIETMVREMGMVLLEIEGKAEGILEVHSMVEVEDEVGSIKAQMSDAQE